MCLALFYIVTLSSPWIQFQAGSKPHGSENSSYFIRSLWRLNEGGSRLFIVVLYIWYSAVFTVTHQVVGCRTRTCPVPWLQPLPSGTSLSPASAALATSCSCRGQRRLSVQPVHSPGPEQATLGNCRAEVPGGKSGSCSLGGVSFHLYLLDPWKASVAILIAWTSYVNDLVVLDGFVHFHLV